MSDKPRRRLGIPSSTRSVFHSMESDGRYAGDSQGRIEVRLILRNNPSSAEIPSLEQACEMDEGYEGWSQRFGADSEDVAKVEAFAKEYDLKVESADAGQRIVRLSGSVSDISRAFDVRLYCYKLPQDRSCFGHTQDPSVPEELEGIVEGVFGLDSFPLGRKMSQAENGSSASSVLQTGIKPVTPKFFPPQVAELYNFPPEFDGKGQTVGLIQLGGGFDEAVLKDYFTFLGIPESEQPEVVAVEAGGKNDYDPTTVETFEVMLDIEVVGSIVPGAKIVCYFGSPNGYVETLHAALNDTVNKPSIVSNSWATAEILMTSAEMKNYTKLAAEAAAKGVTLFGASGDYGSNISASAAQSPLGFINNLALPFFPSTHPGVTSCGGTYLAAKDGRILNEVVWNGLGWLLATKPNRLPENFGATGGGISIVFPVPFYQKPDEVKVASNFRWVYELDQVAENLDSPVVPAVPLGRGIPDIAGNAIGYQTLVFGTAPDDLVSQNGTSAVAPLFAALIAKINQALDTRVGFLNNTLYNQLPPGAIRPITRGSNGAYDAHPDLRWNACTGLGVLDGQGLYNQLKEASRKHAACVS